MTNTYGHVLSSSLIVSIGALIPSQASLGHLLGGPSVKPNPLHCTVQAFAAIFCPDQLCIVRWPLAHQKLPSTSLPSLHKNYQQRNDYQILFIKYVCCFHGTISITCFFFFASLWLLIAVYSCIFNKPFFFF